MSIQFRIWVLSIIGVLFVMGLGVLLVWGRDQGIIPVLCCIGLVSFCFWSVQRLRQQLPPKK
jgi:hypothetical protein